MDPLELNAWIWLGWSTAWSLAALTATPVKIKESRGRRLTHTLPTVAAIGLIFFSSLVPLGFSPLARASGVAVTVLGFLFSVWARVHLGKYWSGTVALKTSHRLIQSGPYAWIRHPIYTGILTAGLGAAISAASLDAFLGAALLIMTYIIKSAREEVWLTREFGEEYEGYAARTPRLIPLLW